MQENRDSAIKVRVLYATEDVCWLDILKVALKELRQEGVIAGWECYDVSAGPADSLAGGWYGEGDALVCVLISQHFFASNFSAGLEMERLLERHEDGEIVVVPILLHDIDWRQSSFALLHTLGRQAPYVIRWSDALSDFVCLPEAMRCAIEVYQRHATVAPTAPDFATAQQMVRKLLLANCQQELLKRQSKDDLGEDRPSTEASATLMIEQGK